MVEHLLRGEEQLEAQFAVKAVKVGVLGVKAEVAVDVGELAESFAAHIAGVPMWMRLWVVNLQDSLKHLPHSSH